MEKNLCRDGEKPVSRWRKTCDEMEKNLCRDGEKPVSRWRKTCVEMEHYATLNSWPVCESTQYTYFNVLLQIKVVDVKTLHSRTFIHMNDIRTLYNSKYEIHMPRLLVLVAEAKQSNESQRFHVNCLVAFSMFTPLNYCCERFSIFCMLFVLKLSQKKASKTNVWNSRHWKAVLFEIKMDAIKKQEESSLDFNLWNIGKIIIYRKNLNI
jgi:hypothetical protein